MDRAAAYAGPAETGLEPDDDAAYRFLSWWFKDCNRGVIELCWTGVSGKPTEFRRFDDIGQLVRIACELNEAPGVNVYIRAATIALSLDERRHTTDHDVALLPGCWADCDDAAAAARAMDCTLAGVRVCTGHVPADRVHLWIKFSEPVAHPLWVREFNQRLHLLTQGDASVVNPSRMMRLPGSIAWPYKAGRVAELVELVPDSDWHTVTPDLLRGTLPPLPQAGRTNGAGSAGAEARTELLHPLRALFEQIDANATTTPCGHWHDPVLRLIAMLTSRGMPDVVIMALAEHLTWPGYTVAQTREDLAVMLAGAHRRGFVPDEQPESDDGWGDAVDPPAFAEATTMDTWRDLNLPAEDRWLGDLLTSDSRMFLVGRTGLGKTLLAYAIAAGIASGRGFLHWPCSRPGRVLIIDGEMSTRLIKQRVMELLARQSVPPNAAFIYALDRAEALAEQFSGLGMPSPLNDPAGQRFVLRLVDLVRPDVVIFDNVMSLVVGDHKDELPWTATWPLVAELTRRSLAQLWLDHTGHNTDRQYGSSTKSWRFDTLGIMTPLPEAVAGETGFTLSFEAPGKARRRGPDNWREFAPTVIRLTEDGWTGVPAEESNQRYQVKPGIKLFHSALLDALVVAQTRPGETTKAAWLSEAIRRGLIDPAVDKETGQQRHLRLLPLRRAQSDLLAAGWIGINGDQISDLTQTYRAFGL